MFMVYDDIEYQKNSKSGIVSSDSHESRELSIIHHKHEDGEYKDAWCAIKDGFQEQEHQVGRSQRTLLCSVSEKNCFVIQEVKDFFCFYLIL